MKQSINPHFRIKILFIFLTVSLSFYACSKKDEPIAPVAPPVADTRTLKEKALFPIGAAVTVAHLKEADFEIAFKKENRWKQGYAKCDQSCSRR